MSRPNRVAVAVRADLATGVLPAVVAMLAARAEFPLDRLDEALLLTDAVAAHAPARSANGEVQLDLVVDDDGLTFAIGGLVPGGSAGLLADAALPEVGAVLERIADDIRTETADGDGTERLLLHMHAPAPAIAVLDGDAERR